MQLFQSSIECSYEVENGLMKWWKGSVDAKHVNIFVEANNTHLFEMSLWGHVNMDGDDL